MMQQINDRPTIAVAIGDPAGVSPELTARLLASERVREAARIVVVGDRRVLAAGAKVAGLDLDVADVTEDDPSPAGDRRHALIDLRNLDPADVPAGVAGPVGGRFATENFASALTLAARGRAEAVCFTPFNKKAMRYAYAGYDDEIRFIADTIGFKGKAREFNVLENIWNARVTSHIPLKDVAAHLSEDVIVAEVRLTAECLQQAGIKAPRIMVAGLNPHAGDGGSFGTEEIEVIEPAVGKAAAEGYDVAGPYPADTVFLTAMKGGYHAVLTMYHDQGQIAMKMMGFDRGVTMLGGLPFPICTPAHGTAYDIVGKGIANPRATEEALLLAARMAVARR